MGPIGGGIGLKKGKTGRKKANGGAGCGAAVRRISGTEELRASGGGSRARPPESPHGKSEKEGKREEKKANRKRNEAKGKKKTGGRSRQSALLQRTCGAGGAQRCGELGLIGSAEIPPKEAAAGAAPPGADPELRVAAPAAPSGVGLRGGGGPEPRIQRPGTAGTVLGLAAGMETGPIPTFGAGPPKFGLWGAGSRRSAAAPMMIRSRVALGSVLRAAFPPIPPFLHRG